MTKFKRNGKKKNNAIIILLTIIVLCNLASNKEDKNKENVYKYEVATESVDKYNEAKDVVSASNNTTELELTTEVVTEEDIVEYIENNLSTEETTEIISYSSNNSDDIIVEDFSGNYYVTVNDNIPKLEKEDAANGTFIKLSELDSLGRCGVAYMCAGPETLPKEERGEIGHVRPSGWHTVKYPDLISDLYLYNRCHLLMFALSGINDDERNLITGTRQFNADAERGMLHFEDMVLDYVRNTGNHILYKVEPIFDDDDLVAKGVHMQASSVEDDNLFFNVFVYNIEDGITIDYKTGDSWENGSVVATTEVTTENVVETIPEEVVVSTEAENTVKTIYILNTNTKRIHRSNCKSVSEMKDKNKAEYDGDLNELLKQGYKKCKNCF